MLLAATFAVLAKEATAMARSPIDRSGASSPAKTLNWAWICFLLIVVSSSFSSVHHMQRSFDIGCSLWLRVRPHLLLPACLLCLHAGVPAVADRVRQARGVPR